VAGSKFPRLNSYANRPSDCPTLTGLLLLEQAFPESRSCSRESDLTNPSPFRNNDLGAGVPPACFLKEPGDCIRGHWYEGNAKISR